MKKLQLPDISEFDYPLPHHRIAKYPLPRGESKLLVYEKGQAISSQYRDISAYLPPNSALIFNETKVVQARLLFPLDVDRMIEVFCLEPAQAQSVESAMQSRGSIHYHCLIGGAKKWKKGSLEIDLGDFRLRATKEESLGAHFRVKLEWDADLSFAEVLALAGKTPLPPYIKRAAEAQDVENYQTVYASRPGSVAAPTAGLHFSDSLLAQLEADGHQRHFLTLHVGAGTFRPVDRSVAEHEMHAEEFQIELPFVKQILSCLEAGRPIVPVGTTSLRALESMYWLGCKVAAGQLQAQENWHLEQWVAFAGDTEALAPVQAFGALVDSLSAAELSWKEAKTALIIAPGYQHRLISALITNFHQPKSTLLLLVASLVGDDWKSIYRYALQQDYRFLSYGDGCLLKR